MLALVLFRPSAPRRLAWRFFVREWQSSFTLPLNMVSIYQQTIITT
jgi:hypothetical protein